MRVFLLNTEVKTQNKYITLTLRAALAAHPRVEAVALGEHGTAVREFIDGRYDVFFGFGGATHHAPLLARLCGLAKVSVLWATEDPYELAENVRLSDPFNLVFTNDLASVPAYEGRARHLPLAASELFNDLPAVEDEERFLYDLCFIGTAWPNRVATINRVLSHFGPRLRVKIALPYNEFLERPKILDPGLIVDWRCSNIDFARFANRSRVLLSINRRFSAAGAEQATGSTPPPRLFEGALAGACQVYLSDSAEAARYFEPGREFLPCRTDDEAVAAIEELLASPARRLAMARAARTRALAEHTYRHRVERILADAAERLAVPRSVRPAAAARTVLVVTHNIAGDRAGGGIEIYQEYLRNLPTRYCVLFLYPLAGTEEPTFRLIGPSNQVTDFPVVLPVSRFDLHNAAVESMFERILYEQRVDLVHFQHLLGFPLSLPLIARACGVPSLWTAHDHYLICSRFTLLDYEGRFCDTAARGTVHCDICLAADGGQPNGSQTRRRNFMRVVLDALDLVIVNTPFTADYLQAVYPGVPPGKFRVVEMLMPRAKAPPPRPPDPPRPAATLRVALPGNFTDVKGGHYLLRLFNLTRDEDIHYSILGRVDPVFADGLRNLRLTKVAIRGGYDHNDILELLQQCEVSLHCSIWPETYVIALSEAWAAGLVPIVTDIGAQGERVTHGVDGLKVSPHDPAAIAVWLRRIRDGGVSLDAMRAAIARKRLVTPREHLARLQGLYDQLMARYPLPGIERVFRYRRYFAMSAYNAGTRTNAPTWNHRNPLWDDQLDEVVSPPPAIAVLRDELPAQYGSRPRLAMSIRDDGVRWALDDVNVDGEALNPLVRRFRARQSIRLRGWIDVDNGLPLVETYIRLRSASMTVLVAAGKESRPDVADALGKAEAMASGFNVVVPLIPLPVEDFAIAMLQVYPDRIVELGDVGELTIDRGTAAGGVWQAGLDSFVAGRASVEVDTNRLALRIVGGEKLDRNVVGLPANARLVVDGWTDRLEGRELAPRVAVALQRLDGKEAMWVPAKRCRATPEVVERDPILSYAGITLNVDLPADLLGRFRVLVLQDWGDCVGIGGATDMIHIGDSCSLKDAGVPGAEIPPTGSDAAIDSDATRVAPDTRPAEAPPARTNGHRYREDTARR